MLRVALFSLVLGVVVTIVGLPLTVTRSEPQAEAPVVFSGAQATIALGDAEPQRESVRIDFSTLPIARLDFKLPSGYTTQFAFMVIEFEQIQASTPLTLAWPQEASANSKSAAQHYFRLPVRSRGTLWIQLSEISHWPKASQAFSLLLGGRPGETAELRRVSLLPYSALNHAQAIGNDWVSFDPWRRSSMNAYSGVTQLSPFYPVPLIVCVMFASLFAYGTWQLLRRRTIRFDWRIPGVIVLVGWLLLDLKWQYKLAVQAQETYAQFSGKTTAEKLRSGPDAAIYALVEEARKHITEPDARVFVASSDSYSGLRAAYYLYPHNVYWELRGRELPFRIYRRPGDYVLVIKPSTLAVNRRKGIIQDPQKHIDVEVLTTRRTGSLLRLQ